MIRSPLLSLATLALVAACSGEVTAPRITTVPDARFANSPPKPGAHFQSASATLEGTTLVASFREVGLGEGNVTETLSADATAEYACQNNGGQFPNDPRKQSIEGPLSATQDFPVAKNGHVEGSLSISAPASTLDCPSGQHVVMVSVTYTNVTLTDVTNQTTVDIPGTFSAVFFTDVP
jgi:hypothetical protein